MVAVNEVYSGIHPTARGNIDSCFSEKESKIAARWSEYFYITSAGRRQAGTGEFKFFLVKPTSTIEEALGISKDSTDFLCFLPYIQHILRGRQSSARYQNSHQEYSFLSNTDRSSR